MKKQLLFFFLLIGMLFTFQNVNAQGWPPVGATWYFTQIQMTSNEVGYNKIEVEKDTVVQGKNCKKLVGNFDGCSWRSRIMYESNDSVYFFHSQNNEFAMLYDFGATTGDIWKIPNITSNFGFGSADTTKLIVDSIGHIIVSGENLRVIYTTQLNPTESEYEFGGQIIERIGALIMFPSFSSCDPVPGILRCYEDSLINYHRDTSIACDYSTVGLENYEKDEFAIYPNPVKDYLFIDGQENPNSNFYNINIQNIDGELVGQDKLESNTGKIFLGEISPGIYFIKIIDDKNRVVTKKMIKQ